MRFSLSKFQSSTNDGKPFMSSGPDHQASPAVGLAEALSEKAISAERVIAGVRLIVIASNSLIYAAFGDKSVTIPRLAYWVIALSWVYAVFVYFFEPYRRFAVFLSAYFSSISDAAFIMLWLYATGGFYSPFYVLLFPAMVSVAFRFTARETTFASLLYSGAYFTLVLSLDQLAGHAQEILVRITYIFLTAVLGHLISREVLEQTKSKISYKEHMRVVEAAEVKFRAIAETASEAIILADGSGNLIYSNPSAQRMFGYSAEEILKRPLETLVGRTGVVGATLEIAAQKKDGSEFPAELSLGSWTAGEVTYCTVVLRDFTERKRAAQTALELMREQTLRAIAEEAEHRSTFLAEASRVLGASLDHEANLRELARLIVPTFADSCAIDLIENDGPVKRITHCTIDASTNVLVEQEPQFLPIGEELTQVLDSGRSSLPVKPRTAVSTRVPWLVVPMIAPRVRGAITFAMERSGRSFAQTEIAIGEELGRRAAAAVEHSRLFKEAEEAVQARDDFLSVASHELNTPLTALKLQMDMLLQQVGPEATHLRNRVVRARRQVLRITKLIGNLLDVSRISSGKLALEFEDVDFCEVLREVVERLEETCRRAGSSLQISVPGPVIGRWDRMRIEQVVTNLLTNAIKYGEGKPIEISVEKSDDVARLKICDSGIGIPPEEQPRIFDRFSRAQSVHRYGGFGLGLWIVRQIVDALGGSIEVQSKPDEGSTFLVKLPLSPEAAVPGPKSSPGLAQAP